MLPELQGIRGCCSPAGSPIRVHGAPRATPNAFAISSIPRCCSTPTATRCARSRPAAPRWRCDRRTADRVTGRGRRRRRVRAAPRRDGGNRPVSAVAAARPREARAPYSLSVRPPCDVRKRQRGAPGRQGAPSPGAVVVVGGASGTSRRGHHRVVGRGFVRRTTARTGQQPAARYITLALVPARACVARKAGSEIPARQASWRYGIDARPPAPKRLRGVPEAALADRRECKLGQHRRGLDRAERSPGRVAVRKPARDERQPVAAAPVAVAVATNAGPRIVRLPDHSGTAVHASSTPV